MTATVTHNQSMSGVILTGARSGFFVESERRGFHSLQECSTFIASTIDANDP